MGYSHSLHRRAELEWLFGPCRDWLWEEAMLLGYTGLVLTS
jgi:hypothetical protein